MIAQILVTPITIGCFIAGFVTLWLLGILLMRKLSGWQNLSRFHVETADFTNSKSTSVAMSGSGLGTATIPCKIRLDPKSDSILLRPHFLLGPFHRPLKIPKKNFNLVKSAHSHHEVSVPTDCGGQDVTFIIDKDFNSLLTIKTQTGAKA